MAVPSQLCTPGGGFSPGEEPIGNEFWGGKAMANGFALFWWEWEWTAKMLEEREIHE